MAEDKNLDYEIKFDDSGFKTAAQEVARRFRMLEKEAESMTSGTTGAVGEFGRDIESYSKLTEEQLDRMIGEFEKARLWMNKVGFRLPIGFPDGTYQFPDSDADIGEELEKVAKVKKAWEELGSAKRRLAELESGGSGNEGETGSLRERIAHLEGTLGPKGGNAGGGNGAGEGYLKAWQELMKKLIQLELDTQKEKIGTMKDGIVKDLLLLKVNHRQTVSQILMDQEAQRGAVRNVQRAERSSAVEGGEDGSGWLPDESAVQALIGEVDRKARERMAAADQLYASGRQALLASLQQEWAVWADAYAEAEGKIEKLRIKAQQQRDEIEKAQKSGMISEDEAALQVARVNAGEKSQEAQLEVQRLKLSDAWLDCFRELDGLGRKELRQVIDHLNELLTGSELQPAEFNAVHEQLLKVREAAAGLRPFTGFVEGMRSVKEASLKAAEATRKVAGAQEEVNRAREESEKHPEDKGAQSRLKAAGQKLRAARKEERDAGEALEKSKKLRSDSFKESLSNGADSMKAVSGLTNVFGADSEPVVEGIIGAFDSLASIDFKNPLSIVKGAVSAITSLMDGIFQQGDKHKEERIRRLQEEIDGLQNAYNELDKTADKSYSYEASETYAKQAENLAQQNAKIQEQIKLEQDKKKTDKEKIKAWENTIRENLQTIEALKEKQIDAIFGEDIKTAIDNFARAYVDAWAAGNDKAESVKDVVRNMIRNVVTEMVKSRLNPGVDALRKSIRDALQDGVISASEENIIARLTDDIYRQADRIANSTLDKYILEEPQDERQAAARGIATASQESVDLNNGLLTNIQGHTSMIRDSMSLLTETVSGIFTEVAGREERSVSIAPAVSPVAESMQMLTANTAALLQHLVGIENNTAYCRRLEEIERHISAVKNGIDSINTKGIIIKR